MATIWTALADEHRRELLDELAREPASVGELSTRLGMSQPQTSKHLRVLREVGLVASKNAAQRRIYQVHALALQPLDDWMAPYRRLWNARLDALGEHLDKES